jgi:hypothetical protein
MFRTISQNPTLEICLSFFALVCLTSIQALGQNSSQPLSREVKTYNIEQFMDTESVGGSSFSHDEKAILFHINKTGIFNVFAIGLKGSVLRQLTDSRKRALMPFLISQTIRASSIPMTAAETKTIICMCES